MRDKADHLGTAGFKNLKGNTLTFVVYRDKGLLFVLSLKEGISGDLRNLTLLVGPSVQSEYYTNIATHQRINPAYLGDLLTFSLSPP